jgi:hypothetical protein
MLWAVKDPRVCRLLPWWLDIFAAEGISPHFIFVIRSPEAVYRSLARRDGFSRKKSYLLWLMHYLEAEIGSRGQPRVFTSFDQFLDNPSKELSRIEALLGVKFPISVEAAQSGLAGFLSKELKHYEEEKSHLYSSFVVDLANELHARLQLATVLSGNEIVTDDLFQKLESVQSNFDELLVEHLQSVGRHRGKATLTVNRLVRSWSWFTGKPVRFIERLFGRHV